MKPKVVFDTNIFISAIIFGSNPRVCLELARQGKIELYTSRKILFELSQKLKSKFEWQEEDVVEVIEGLLKFTKIVTPQKKLSVIKKDPSDNKILECAKEAKATYIISGDKKHILPLKKFGEITILNSKQFLNHYYKNQ